MSFGCLREHNREERQVGSVKHDWEGRITVVMKCNGDNVHDDSKRGGYQCLGRLICNTGERQLMNI